MSGRIPGSRQIPTSSAGRALCLRDVVYRLTVFDRTTFQSFRIVLLFLSYQGPPLLQLACEAQESVGPVTRGDAG